MTTNKGAIAKLPAADFEYWTQRCVPMVSSLLTSCGVYSSGRFFFREAQLNFLLKYVVPNLGPRPTGPDANVFSMATFSAFPLQPSINLSNSGVAKLRYTFEPLDTLSGTRI